MTLTRLGDRLTRVPVIRDHPELEVVPIETAGPDGDWDEPGLEHLRPWRFRPTPWGDCRVYEERSPCPPPAAVPELARLVGDERLDSFDPDRALYLDIEATGLSHGAGTFAFLIGCAYVEGGEVVLEQLFMSDPTDEMPVLGRFLELIERFDFLVSFNGKSYDLSVLQARLVITRLLSRVDVDLKVRPHLDLLHLSRQAWKGVFENTKLQTLEREVLDLDPAERADDVPGSMVPALYFHYLQTGHAPHLHPVLAHNRTDVLSMITLTRRLLDLLEDPDDEPALVQYNLGRAALRRKLNARACRLIGNAVRSGELDPITHRKALLELITARRRAADWPGAARAAAASIDLVPPWNDPERDRLQRQITKFQRRAAATMD